MCGSGRRDPLAPQRHVGGVIVDERSYASAAEGEPLAGLDLQVLHDVHAGDAQIDVPRQTVPAVGQVLDPIRLETGIRAAEREKQPAAQVFGDLGV